NMIVLSPCDAIEAKKATIAAAKINKPVYIRLAREKTPIMTTEATPFEIGKAQTLWKSKNPKVGIIATGALLHKALEAAQELDPSTSSGQGKRMEVEVMNLSTIKPLDEKAIVD